MAISVLCDEGDTLLVSQPGFPLSRGFCANLNINIKFYDLIPEKNWECDLSSIRKQIDEKTKAILITNPSNPCGAVFSKEH